MFDLYSKQIQICVFWSVRVKGRRWEYKYEWGGGDKKVTN